MGPKTLWFQAHDSTPGSIAFGCIHFCFLHSIYMILILLFCYFCYCFRPVILGPETLQFQAWDPKMSGPWLHTRFHCLSVCMLPFPSFYLYIYMVHILLICYFCCFFQAHDTVTPCLSWAQNFTLGFVVCGWVCWKVFILPMYHYLTHISLFNWKIIIIYIYIYIL